MKVKPKIEYHRLSREDLKKQDDFEKLEQKLKLYIQKDEFKKGHLLIEENKKKFIDSYDFYTLCHDFYMQFKVFEGAKFYVLQAIKLHPQNTITLIALAKIMIEQGQKDEAIQLLQTAADANQDIGLYGYLATIYHDDGNFVLSHQMRKIIAHYEPSFENKITSIGAVPAVFESDAHGKECIEIFEKDIQELSRTSTQRGAAKPHYFPQALFFLSYLDINQKGINQRVSKAFRRIFRDINFVAPHIYRWHPQKHDQKIKISFVSRFLSRANHSVYFCFKSIVDGLIQSGKFDVEVIFTDVDKSHYTHKFEGAENHHIPNPARLGDHLVKRENDILVYTDIGMEPISYFMGHMRLAKFQCMFGGHPVTSGIDTIDYFISSRVVEVDDAADHYSEQLVLFPDKLGDYPPMESKTHANVIFNPSSFGLPMGKRIYSCPMMIQKISPKMDIVFRKIFENDDKAIVVLFNNRQGHSDSLLARFQKTLGPYLDRLYILKTLTLGEFHEFLKNCSVVLDSHPFGGGNTSFQCLSNDVPIITWPSEYGRGRATQALYKMMKVEGLVAKSLDEYADLALKVAKNPAPYKKLIHENKHHLFDGKSANTDFIDFFSRIGYGETIDAYLPKNSKKGSKSK